MSLYIFFIVFLELFLLAYMIYVLLDFVFPLWIRCFTVNVSVLLSLFETILGRNCDWQYNFPSTERVKKGCRQKHSEVCMSLVFGVHMSLAIDGQVKGYQHDMLDLTEGVTKVFVC